MKQFLALFLLLFLPVALHATVTSQTTSVSFTCSGSTGPYPFVFPISDATALTVIQAGTTLASTAYTVTPVNNNYANGGSVTLSTACPAASTLVLKRNTPLTQATVYTDNMPVPMKTFERGLDKLTEIDQDILQKSVTCPSGQFFDVVSLGGTSSCAPGTAGPQGPIGPPGSGGIGNQKTVWDVSTLAGADWSVKTNACLSALPAAGGTCDGRGMPSPNTMSVNIAPTNQHVHIIFPAGTINKALGKQFVPQSGEFLEGTPSLGGYGTIIVSAPGETLPTFYSGVAQIYNVEISHIQTQPTSQLIDIEAPFAYSYIHDSNFGGLLLPTGLGGCNCYNIFKNNSFNGPVGTPNSWAMELDGFSNVNIFSMTHVNNNAASGGGLKVCGASSENIFDEYDFESVNANMGRGIELCGPTRKNTFRLPHIENTHSNPTTQLAVLDSGAMYNTFDSAIDVIDNSGNTTNTYGSLVTLPPHVQPAGRVVANQITTPNITVEANRIQWGSVSSATIPAESYFPGSTWSLELWAKPTVDPLNPFLLNFNSSVGGGGAHDLDLRLYGKRVQLATTGGGTIYSGPTEVLTTGAWNYIGVTYSGGAATIYINGVAGVAGAQTITAPANVSYLQNAIGVLAGNPQGYGQWTSPFFGAIAHVAVYNSALTAGNISEHYTRGSSGSGYQTDITGGANGGPPIFYWPMNDAPITNAMITGVTVNGDGTATYAGTFGSVGNASNQQPFWDYYFTFSGFGDANDGTYLATESTPIALTVMNSSAITESVSATATYPGAVNELMASANGQYLGHTLLDSITGIPGDTTGSGKAARFGGDTTYTYYLVGHDWTGGTTAVSSAGTVVNYSPLTGSDFNILSVQTQPQMLRTYDFLNGSNQSLALGVLLSSMPVYDTGRTPSAYTVPTDNTTGYGDFYRVHLGTPPTDGGTPLCFDSSGIVATGCPPALSVSFDLPQPVVGDNGLYQHKFAKASTLTRISCSTDTGTVAINFDVRAEATPNVAGTNVLGSDLTCTTTTGVTSTFSAASVGANLPLNLQVNGASGSPGVVRIHVAYQ